MVHTQNYPFYGTKHYAHLDSLLVSISSKDPDIYRTKEEPLLGQRPRGDKTPTTSLRIGEGPIQHAVPEGTTGYARGHDSTTARGQGLEVSDNSDVVRGLKLLSLRREKYLLRTQR
jgi:hypothetical protein